MQPSLGLQVTLASQLPTLHAQSSTTVPVKVSIQNTGSEPVTFLKWGTPFDAHAAVSGVFEVRDTADGRVLPLDVLKMSRKLPASTEDLIEVAGGQSLDNVVELPGLNFEEGHDYSIITQGIWHALWNEPRVNVTASQLSDFSGAKRDARDVFEVLQNGGIAIIPSNVGYGIVAIDPAAVRRIFLAKKRPAS
ncbi:putative secreted protein [Penicillium rolfsii]|nr:putative secreted protein [Penicillium rolfsii]